MDNSLILNIFQRTGTGDSLISEILNNKTDDSLKLQRTAQHCCQEHLGWICGCAFPHTHTHTPTKIK
jgi:hypothetical protein